MLLALLKVWWLIVNVHGKLLQVSILSFILCRVSTRIIILTPDCAQHNFIMVLMSHNGNASNTIRKFFYAKGQNNASSKVMEAYLLVLLISRKQLNITVCMRRTACEQNFQTVWRMMIPLKCMPILADLEEEWTALVLCTDCWEFKSICRTPFITWGKSSKSSQSQAIVTFLHYIIWAWFSNLIFPHFPMDWESDINPWEFHWCIQLIQGRIHIIFKMRVRIYCTWVLETSKRGRFWALGSLSTTWHNAWIDKVLNKAHLGGQHVIQWSSILLLDRDLAYVPLDRI